MLTIDAVMRAARVIPVLVEDDPSGAAALAEKLVAAGYPVLEVTMRTPSALEVLREMRGVAGAIVGAGTVLNARSLDACLEAGAQFIVSPGLTTPLAHAAIAASAPFLPGVASAGDIMRGLDHGFDRFKFFPAVPAGGIPALQALAAPFSQVRFCPTGGITRQAVPDWLALEAVLCVGGSWVAASV